MQEDSRKRVAMNEATFRRINDGIRNDRPIRRIAFVCECGRLGCNQLIELDRSEYEAVRSDAHRFAVVPGHEIPEVEDVVERHEAYMVIQKHRDTWDVVEGSDPRRPLGE